MIMMSRIEKWCSSKDKRWVTARRKVIRTRGGGHAGSEGCSTWQINILIQTKL